MTEMSKTPITPGSIATISDNELKKLFEGFDERAKEYSTDKVFQNEEAKRARLETIFAHGWTAKSLLEADFPEPEFIVPGLIPEGLTIIAGSPKIGKSWFALQLATALATGGCMFGEIQIDKREVLYMALEDSPRRLANRMKKLNTPKVENLHIFNEWLQNDKAIQRLRYFKEYRPELSVIIIDTLQSLRGLNDNSYSQDYVDLTAIRALCNELQVSIILIHHTRKMESEDPVMEISGTHGISGVCATILVMKKERRKREATLFVTSRDIEETEMVLQFDAEIGSWSILGDADFVRLTVERQEIVEIVEEAGECSLSDIQKRTGKTTQNTWNLVKKLTNEGFLIKTKYGKYCTPNSGVSDVSSVFDSEDTPDTPDTPDTSGYLPYKD